MQGDSQGVVCFGRAEEQKMICDLAKKRVCVRWSESLVCVILNTCVVGVVGSPFPSILCASLTLLLRFCGGIWFFVLCFVSFPPQITTSISQSANQPIS